MSSKVCKYAKIISCLQIGTILDKPLCNTTLFYLILALKSSNTERHSRFSHIILGSIYTVVGICSLINLTLATNIIFVVVRVLVGLTWIVEGIISLFFRHYLDSNKGFLTSGGESIIAGLIFLLVPFWGGDVPLDNAWCHFNNFRDDKSYSIFNLGKIRD